MVGDENWFLIDCKKINTKIFNKALRSERARSLLKEEYNIRHKASNFSSLRKVAVSQVKDGIWQGEYADTDAILFTIWPPTVDASIDNRSQVSISSFIEYIILHQIKGSDFDAMYQDFVNEQFLAYEENQLEIKYPEYKALLNEYRCSHWFCDGSWNFTYRSLLRICVYRWHGFSLGRN